MPIGDSGWVRAGGAPFSEQPAQGAAQLHFGLRRIGYLSAQSLVPMPSRFASDATASGFFAKRSIAGHSDATFGSGWAQLRPAV